MSRASDGGFWTLAAFLAAVHVGNILGPPPPSVLAIWTSAIAGGAILVAWIWWVDRHRDIGPVRPLY